MLIFSSSKEEIFYIMPPTSCMICQKTGRMYYYNVYTSYDNINHTIRDDFVELFGLDVEQYLSPSYFLCGVCTTILRNASKLKRMLWPLVCCNALQNCKPVKLGRIWDIFASLKFEDDSDEDDHTLACRTPTPSKLLELNYSKAYNHNLEQQIANIERNRSLSRASSGFGRSDVSVTSEVARITNRRRRRRNGHKNWTRHKRHSKSPATSVYSVGSVSRYSGYSDLDHSYSPVSDCSYQSSYTVKKKSPVKKGVEYDYKGRLIRKRTRSVSRAQEEEARQLEILDSNKLCCGEPNCLLHFEDIDVLNYHRIKLHNMLALHFCDECGRKYTTLQLLKLHKKIHDVYPFLCPLCACDVKNQEALQDHLEEHMTYSVRCKYCDKSFLNRKSCETHYKSIHSNRREHITHKKKIILGRIDKSPPLNNSAKNSVSDKCNSDDDSSDNYNVYVSLYTDMEYSNKDLDVTEENFKVKGMDFIVDSVEDCEMDDSESTSPSRPSEETTEQSEISVINGVLTNSSTSEGDV